jgi:nitroreductase
MTTSVTAANPIKRAPATDGVLDIFLDRWSPRSFTDRSVSAEDLKRIFEAARWSPSSSNEQPWRFIVGIKGTDTFDKIVSTLGGFNQAWAHKAPVLLLGVARKHFVKNDAPNHYALFDLGQATAAITLEAAALGIATHQMGGFDHDIARKALGIPEEFAIGSVMAIGYVGDPSALPESYAKSETSPRSRKPLDEVALSAWDEPLKLD